MAFLAAVKITYYIFRTLDLTILLSTPDMLNLVKEAEALTESRKSKRQKIIHHVTPIASNSAQIAVDDAAVLSLDDEILDCIVVEQ
jgi:hypothetical protein